MNLKALYDALASWRFDLPSLVLPLVLFFGAVFGVRKIKKAFEHALSDKVKFAVDGVIYNLSDLPVNFHPVAIRASAVDTPFGAM